MSQFSKINNKHSSSVQVQQNPEKSSTCQEEIEFKLFPSQTQRNCRTYARAQTNKEEEESETKVSNTTTGEQRFSASSKSSQSHSHHAKWPLSNVKVKVQTLGFDHIYSTIKKRRERKRDSLWGFDQNFPIKKQKEDNQRNREFRSYMGLECNVSQGRHVRDKQQWWNL